MHKARFILEVRWGWQIKACIVFKQLYGLAMKPLRLEAYFTYFAGCSCYYNWSRLSQSPQNNPRQKLQLSVLLSNEKVNLVKTNFTLWDVSLNNWLGIVRVGGWTAKWSVTWNCDKIERKMPFDNVFKKNLWFYGNLVLNDTILYFQISTQEALSVLYRFHLLHHGQKNSLHFHNCYCWSAVCMLVHGQRKL